MERHRKTGRKGQLCAGQSRGLLPLRFMCMCEIYECIATISKKYNFFFYLYTILFYFFF